MKILFFNYEYPPLGGGAGNATFYIMRQFAKIPGVEIDVITSSANNEFQIKKIGENVRVHKLPIGKDGKNLLYQSNKDLLIYAWKAYFYARKLVKKEKYDLTHSFFTIPCGAISLALKFEYGLPYIVSLRGSDVPGYNSRFSLIYTFLTPFIKYIWKKSKAVIANSEGLKDLALQTKKDQTIGIIYNGIDTEEFHPTELRQNSNSEKFQVVCVSRLTARRGINYIIEAINILSKKYPNIYLKVVGEGDERENLETQIKDLTLNHRVELAGRLSHEAIAQVLQESKVFVLVPLQEGMSNAMLEALASGLPIVATDAGGTKELVTDGVNGYIVKMQDSEDIAQKLETIIINPDLMVSLGKESRKIAEEMSWQKVTDKYYQLYQEVTQK